MKIRNITAADYEKLGQVVNEWGSHSSIYSTVPRLFFEHFQPTSFIMELEDETLAILIGFVSQTDEQQAYVHFLGVNPHFRKQGIARQMYKHFLDAMSAKGCKQISAITTPINRASIALHESLGFSAERHEDYNGPGEHRITFTYNIQPITANR